VGDGLTLAQKKVDIKSNHTKFVGSLGNWNKTELMDLVRQTLSQLDQVTQERDMLLSRVDSLSRTRAAELPAEDFGKQKQYVKTGGVVTVSTKQEDNPLRKGVVKHVLTNSSYHPHGIKVRLEGGDVGRVVAIHPTPEAAAK